jgi:serine/threonine protein kinase
MEFIKPGTMLKDKYEIKKLLSKGERGGVYLCYEDHLSKNWAIKELHTDLIKGEERKKALEQFKIEAKLLANLNHTNIPKVIDYFEASGKHYLVMDYIEGWTLKQVIESSSSFIAVRDLINWGIKICEILHFLHSQNPPIIFRDLKPSNVILDMYGELKLVDFGISKIFMPANPTGPFAKVVGSPGFCPPEQYGYRKTDIRSDIYSLGALLYYGASKRIPPESLYIHVGDEALIPLQKLNKLIPTGLEKIILKAMETKAENRFASAEDMKNALISLISGEENHLISEKTSDTDSKLNVVSSFRNIFVDKLFWKETEVPYFDYAASYGVFEKNILLTKFVHSLNYDNFNEFIINCIMAQKKLSLRFLRPAARFYFVCLFLNSSELDKIIESAEKNTTTGVNLFHRFIVPVLLNTREIFDSHIPLTFRDFNGTKNTFLNIRNAVNNIKV